jgi:hypothetical protein
LAVSSFLRCQSGSNVGAHFNLLVGQGALHGSLFSLFDFCSGVGCSTTRASA